MTISQLTSGYMYSVYIVGHNKGGAGLPSAFEHIATGILCLTVKGAFEIVVQCKVAKFAYSLECSSQLLKIWLPEVASLH